MKIFAFHFVSISNASFLDISHTFGDICFYTVANR